MILKVFIVAAGCLKNLDFFSPFRSNENSIYHYRFTH